MPLVPLFCCSRWPDVTAAAKKAYGLRYQLLTYFYTGLFMAHTRGGTLARPLLFADPSDLKARYEDGYKMVDNGCDLLLGCTECQSDRNMLSRQLLPVS